ncbi:MAG: ATP phosphoribosyltransferase [Coriobacteriales bacterium]
MTERAMRVAVPKGSLFPEAVELLAQAGLDTSGLDDPGRHLRIRNGDVEFIIVRASDAPTFIAYGGADCGISGKDTVVEAGLEVIELVDLKFGGCRFVVAEPAAASERVEESYRRLGTLRVATKYPRITKAYYDSIGVQVEIIKLNGNVELAPLIGMADRIVDITATGRTLRENNLRVVADVMKSTARFIANPVSLRTDERVRDLGDALRDIARDKTPSAPIAGAAHPTSKG